jgi:hypothetical protein
VRRATAVGGEGVDTMTRPLRLNTAVPRVDMSSFGTFFTYGHSMWQLVLPTFHAMRVGNRSCAWLYGATARGAVAGGTGKDGHAFVHPRDKSINWNSALEHIPTRGSLLVDRCADPCVGSSKMFHPPVLMCDSIATYKSGNPPANPYIATLPQIQHSCHGSP